MKYWVLVFFISSLFVLGCKSEVNPVDGLIDDAADNASLEDELEATPTPSPTPDSGESIQETIVEEVASETENEVTARLGAIYTLKIVQSGAGNQPPVNDIALTIGDSVDFKCAVYDLNGNYLEDGACSWSVGSSYPGADLVASGDGVSASFTPTLVASTSVQASYIGSRDDLIITSDFTGTITVNSNQIPNLLLKTSGDNQSGTVNNNLVNPITVQLLDTFSLPIEGQVVRFSRSSGSGAVIGTTDITTDENGRASVIVQLGTVADNNSDSFRAELIGYPGVTAAIFTASATPGPPSTLEFVPEPAGALATVAFLTQPQVRIKDAFNNVIPANGLDLVTLSVQDDNGTGATLFGDVTADVSAGLAVFEDVGLSAAGAGIVLRASYDSLVVDTGALTVSSPPPGACQVNDATFTTAYGGCTHIPSQTVWSSRSASNMEWGEAVWDSAFAGSAAPDAEDHGRTNDYSEVMTDSCNQAGPCDNYGSAYCKSLNEGGFNDWRVPTDSEWAALPPQSTTQYLNGVADELVWTTKWGTSSVRVWAWNAWDGTITYRYTYDDYHTYCVRNVTPREPASKLVVTSGPRALGLNSTPSFVYTLAVQDASGNKVNAEDVDITVSIDVGSLSGTTTGTTNENGVGAMTGFTPDTTAASATLTFSAPGLASAEYSISVGDFPHSCVVEDANFQTANGGCEAVPQGLVWSKVSPIKYNWHEVIWDSTSSCGGGVAPDATDITLGRTYDEDSAQKTTSTNCTYRDNASFGYCHQLDEGGFQDWRPPTYLELTDVIAMGASTNAVFPDYRYWSSTSRDSSDNRAYTVEYTGTFTNGSYKTEDHHTICVRSP